MGEERILLSIIIFISFLYNNNSYAQKVDSVDVQQFLEMSISELLNIEIITSSKIPRFSSDITQKVDVVSGQQISTIISGNRNIAEFIQYLPGASVKVLSRNDANWGAYGGIGPKYSTYMVQGLPVDAFIDPMSIDEMAIQHIEIQRGPASVLYPVYLSQDFAGNQSPLAGTVNLILNETVDNPQTMVSLAYGSYNTFTGKAYHENTFGRLNVFGGISYEKSDYINYGSADSWLNMLKNPEYQKEKAFVSATLYIDKAKRHKISLFGNQTIHWGDAGRKNREYNNFYSIVNTSYSAKLSANFEITFKTGLRWYDRTWQEDYYNTNLDQSLRETDGVEQMIIPADLSITLNHFNNSNMTVGADYQQTSYLTWVQPVNQVDQTLNDASASQMGIYIQEELQLNKLTLRGGGRFNYINYEIEKLGGVPPGLSSQSWNVVLWSAGGKYRLSEKISFYTNIGNSLMSPGLKSIGGTLPLSAMYVTGMNGQLPNPDLKPENGISFDLGIDTELPFNIYTSFRAFNTAISHAIIDNVISQNPSQTMSVNTDGKTVGRGFEFSVNQRIEEKIDWFANITYTKSEIIDPDNPDQDGAEVPFVPEIMSNAGITFFLPYNIVVTPRIHFGGGIYDSSSKISRIYYESKEVFNLFISKTFIFAKDIKLNSFVRLYNITNNKYDMPWQFRDPGFNLTLGIKIIL